MFATALNRLEIESGPVRLALDERLDQWQAQNVGRRLWAADPTVWIVDSDPAGNIPELSNRLGWLDLPVSMAGLATELENFAAGIRAAGFSRVVVLGMGGSSLIAEVWSEVFGVVDAGLPLLVLDSTHPLAVAEIGAVETLTEALFLVASKSGGTLETLSFFNYFYQRLSRLRENPGQNFVALTDPGSGLEKLAREKGFRRIFATPATVGGRYSALTAFGLLPAALLGLAPSQLLARAQVMMAAGAAKIAPRDNPALRLGAFLGELVRAGRDKMGLVLSPRLRPFAVWLEQLIAESLGKQGWGLLPVIISETEAVPRCNREGRPAEDAFYVFLRLDGDDNRVLDQGHAQVVEAGLPAALIRLDEPADLAQELWRFELATAAAGAVLGLNPFDQPDVEAAKQGACAVMESWEQAGCLPSPEPLARLAEGRLYGSRHFEKVTDLEQVPVRLLALVKPGDYLALLVYLPRTSELDRVLARLREHLQAACRVPVTLGYGPRYLHSTGQLHKGDGNHGVFLQLSGARTEDLPLPGQNYGFATMIAAQAQGDYQALLKAGRRLLALDWETLSPADIIRHLERLDEAVARLVGVENFEV